jgi:hypothetical protein
MDLRAAAPRRTCALKADRMLAPRLALPEKPITNRFRARLANGHRPECGQLSHPVWHRAALERFAAIAIQIPRSTDL